MVGEYGCRNTTDARGTYWSYMQGSCSEAVYMIGMERNSDVVQMAAYAPMLEHFGFISWSVSSSLCTQKSSNAANAVLLC